MPSLYTRLSRRGAVLALLLGCAGTLVGAEPASSGREYALKAACLYNFCQFIDWPSRLFDSSNAPILIGIYGTDPFGSLLEETVTGEVIRGRPIRIIRCRRVDEARDCHILFMSASETIRLRSVLPYLQGQGIVTVGENDAFLSEGGMIALTSVQNRVRLRINLPAVRDAGVSVSSKLLRVADIIQ